MNYQKNKLANIFKVYSVINFVAALILVAMIDLDDFTPIFISIVIVSCFGIYAIGEVIQLLDEIKQNTAKQGHIDTASLNSTTTPENQVAYSCPTCGRAVIQGQKNCSACGQELTW